MKKVCIFTNLEKKYCILAGAKNSFRQRMNQGYGCIHSKNCYSDGQSTNCHINSLINRLGGKIELYVAILKDDEAIEASEKLLIKALNPCWNIALKPYVCMSLARIFEWYLCLPNNRRLEKC